MSIDILNSSYIPTLYLRNAELMAVKELPDTAKDLLCPIFCLKPWKTAKLLKSSMDQIAAAFGDRRYFLDIDPFAKITEVKRKAQEEYLALIDIENGNQNWIAFFVQYPNAFPCLIANHGDVASVQNQISAFTDSEKTFLVRLNREIGQHFEEIVDAVCQTEHSNFGFVVDVGWSRDLLSQEGWANDLVRRIVSLRGGDIPIVITGSSFPDSFQKFSLGQSVQMKERNLFDNIKAKNNQARLIYGDWASSRSPTEGGGGNPIPPRIDLATASSWEIYRLSEDEGGFTEAAKEAISSKSFPKHLKIWATYMIEATALGDPNGILTQQRAAAVRINLHLYQQLYFDQSSFPLDTDDEYTE